MKLNRHTTESKREVRREKREEREEREREREEGWEGSCTCEPHGVFGYKGQSEHAATQ